MRSKRRHIKMCDKKIEGMRKIKKIYDAAKKDGTIETYEIQLPSDTPENPSVQLQKTDTGERAKRIKRIAALT